jgi:hypothetical protein
VGDIPPVIRHPAIPSRPALPQTNNKPTSRTRLYAPPAPAAVLVVLPGLTRESEKKLTQTTCEFSSNELSKPVRTFIPGKLPATARRLNSHQSGPEALDQGQYGSCNCAKSFTRKLDLQ